MHMTYAKTTEQMKVITHLKKKTAFNNCLLPMLSLQNVNTQGILPQ